LPPIASLAKICLRRNSRLATDNLALLPAALASRLYQKKYFKNGCGFKQTESRQNDLIMRKMLQFQAKIFTAKAPTAKREIRVISQRIE